MQRAIVSWSGGKDAAWALHRARDQYEIAALLTTVGETDGFVPIHRVPGHLIEAQSRMLNIPLWTAPLPQPCTNAVYSARLKSVWNRAEAEGIDAVIFGDLFLSDIRAWREQLLASTALTPVFPLWLQPTAALAREMIGGGLNATVCAIDSHKLSAGLIGTPFDNDFLASLPPETDPCGENGEFHTFVTKLPGFRGMPAVCAASFL